MRTGKEETEKVLEYIKNNDNFSIFYHLDGDGITSTAIIVQALEKLGKIVSGLRPTNYGDFENGIDLSEYQQNLIICDMQVSAKAMLELKTKNLCIIDHHELIDRNGITYINPKMWGDSTYTPCALLTYRIFEKIVPELDWVSAIGLVSDAGGKENSKFLRSVSTKHGIKLDDSEYLYDNDFGEVSTMINSMTSQNGRLGAEEALGILLMSKSFSEVLNNERLISANNSVRKEVDKLRENFEHKKEVYDELVYFFEVDPKKKKYASSVLQPLSLDKQYYKKLLVFMTKINGDTLRINLRANGLELELPEVLREIFKKIKGEGGGHKSASGASIRPEDKEKFKALLLEEVKKRINNN